MKKSRLPSFSFAFILDPVSAKRSLMQVMALLVTQTAMLPAYAAGSAHIDAYYNAGGALLGTVAALLMIYSGRERQSFLLPALIVVASFFLIVTVMYRSWWMGLVAVLWGGFALIPFALAFYLVRFLAVWFRSQTALSQRHRDVSDSNSDRHEPKL